MATVAGSSAVRYAMVSGAGRTVTRRSFEAFRHRSATAAASNSAVTRAAFRSNIRSPTAPRSGASFSSASSRSSGTRHAVSRQTTVACHSEIRPASNARLVCGSSVCRAAANPTCRPPRCCASRRARATCPATDRRTTSGLVPRACPSAVCVAANPTVTVACPPAAHPFNASNAESRLMRWTSSAQSRASCCTCSIHPTTTSAGSSPLTVSTASTICLFYYMLVAATRCFSNVCPNNSLIQVSSGMVRPDSHTFWHTSIGDAAAWSAPVSRPGQR